MAREHWTKRSAFIMAAIGSAIGLGNVWRFPYMAYSNGGGAFLIPYIIALITTGVPLVALEYYLGVRYQYGPSEAYGFIRKRANFIGWFSLGLSSMITFYYAVVIAWSLRYLVASFGVQWAGNEKDFFYTSVLAISSDIGSLGGIQWALVLANFVTWALIFLIIFRGIGIVSKVVAWTVGLPWLLLGILVVRGITLDGAAEGLDFYLKPNFAVLKDPNVWLGAYGQIFFSLSLGFGIMVAYASYLPVDSDINTNAWTVCFSNCATSFFAGFAVFSTLGYLAAATGQPVAEVAGGGPGLAFVIFPTAIGVLPGGIAVQSVFGALFFLMLFTLGIDSAFSLVEAVVTGLKDSFDIGQQKATFWVCFVGFAVGTLYCTGAGLYWLDVVDHWMNWGLIMVGLLEAVLIGWFFNVREVARDIDSTSSIKLGGFFVVCVKYITPLVLLITIVLNVVEEFGAPYEGYPIWALMVGGWMLIVALLLLSFLIQGKRAGADWKRAFSGRTFGWATVFLGLVVSFYLFYQATLSSAVPAVVLVGSVTAGILVITALRKRIPAEEIVEEEGR